MEKPPIFVVDASVAVKWYVKEVMRDKALEIRQHFVSELIELEAPTLLVYEVGNAVRHHPGSTSADYAEAVKQLHNLGLVMHGLDGQIVDTAANLAFEEKLTFYDAVYLALAKNLETMLVTADQKLTENLSAANRSHIMLLQDYRYSEQKESEAKGRSPSG